MAHYDYVCLIIYVSIAVFVNCSSNQLLTTVYVIYTIGYYTKICNSMADFTGLALRCHAVAYASTKRISNFLLTEEKSTITPSKRLIDRVPYIQIKNLSAGYGQDKIVLNEINLNLKEKELLAVVGNIGCGKTSLLLSILNELPYVLNGQVNVNGTIFYVSQEPFIFSASIKQNITFGKPFDQIKFEKVIKLCCLDEVKKI